MAEWRLLLMLCVVAGLAGCGGVGGSDADADASAGPEVTYRRNCFSCHNSGIAGAPRVGDVEAWAPRLAQGWPTLMQNTLGGIGTMPPRGLCRQCSDAQLAEVLRWMLEQSGGLPADAPPAPAAAVRESPASGEGVSLPGAV